MKGERLEGETAQKILPHLSDKSTSRKWSCKTNRDRKLLSPLTHIFNVSKKKKKRSLEMKKGRKKNPYRLYFFHLNCKHLFGCKANRTFISLLRFGLIMSTPTFGSVGRCWGGAAWWAVRWGLLSWSRLGSIGRTCGGARGPLETTGCVLRGGWGAETPHCCSHAAPWRQPLLFALGWEET